MKKLYTFVFLLILLSFQFNCQAQAVLPVSRTAWQTEPTGWTNSGCSWRNTASACSGNDATIFDNTGDFRIVFINAAPNQLTFKLKKQGMSGASSLLVEESATGGAGTYTTLGTYGTAGGATAITDCGNIVLSLNAASRYIRWTYTKGTGNCDMDDVNISVPACTPPADPIGTISGTTPACTNTSLSFSGAVPGGVTYYWQTVNNGTSTANDAASSLNVTTSANYYVRAQDNSTFCWSSSSIGPYAVTINTPVSVTATTPTDQTVTIGSTATFTVTATGTGLSYQWQEDQGSGWNNVGSNSNSYTTPATTALMNGWKYQCIVSGAAPCTPATSRTATLTVSVPLSAGFALTSGSVSENAGTYQIGVVVNTAPASNLVLSVTSGLGTASPSTDYNFTTTNLTFLTSGTYPDTQYTTVTILNDLSPEPNKYRNFTLARVSGPAVTPSPSTHQMTIVDDDVLEGVILNEFSQGDSNYAYLELVVIGIPGTTVDLRGWIIDDNSGIFSGGYGSQLGIADGHIKFSNVCSWEKVPVGSIIVVYVNDQTVAVPTKNKKIKNLGLADDPTDANLDYVYVVGVNFYNSGGCATASANDYFSSDCNLPSNTSYDQYIPATYVNPDLATAQFRNAGDAVQLRDQSGNYFMGLSYGSKGSGSSCGACAINAANHPDFATYGANSLYFSGGSNVTYSFQNTVDNDYRKLSNWTKTTTSSPNILETPGLINSTANQTWINSLRGNFDAVLDDQTYICQLREFESRYYLDAVDKIIFYIKNNANIDHGDLTAETILHDDATAGLGFQNSNLTGTPLFMTKTWAATPTNYSSPNYKIKFFVTTQELQDYCDYINPILNAIPGYYIFHNHTPSEVKSHLKIYKTATSDRAWTVTSDAQVEIRVPTVSTYTSYNGTTYTTFEYTGFTGFSGYALGDIVTPTIGLPVELTSFTAECGGDETTVIKWTTASEFNSNFFTIQKSSDGIHFTDMKVVEASGNSNVPKNYTTTDNNVTAVETYYRLLETDIAGRQNIYSIVNARCDEINTLQTYYTPADGITVQVSSTKDKELFFNVYEISGKLLYQESKNIPKGSSVFKLNMSKNLADGIYIIQSIDGSKISSNKILVH